MAKVYKNGSKTCIVVGELRGALKLIPLADIGLLIGFEDPEDFAAMGWADANYPAVEAAEKYLVFGKRHGMTEEAEAELLKIVIEKGLAMHDRKVYSNGAQALINISPVEGPNINFIGIRNDKLDIIPLTQKEFKEFKELKNSVKDFAKKYLKFAEIQGATSPQALRLLQEIIKGKPIIEEIEMAKKKAAPKVETPKAKKVIEKAEPGKSLMAEKKKGSAKQDSKTKTATKSATKSPQKETSQRAPKEGVGFTVNTLLIKGKTTDEILDAVRAKFPESKITSSQVSWYKGKLKAAGELPA